MIKTTSQTPRDYYLELGRGNIPGASRAPLFGVSSTIGATISTVSSIGDIYQFPTSAATVDISSTSVNDTSAGSGAKSVIISGLDTDFKLIIETISLNGTSTVTTVVSFLRINMTVVESGATNEGTIDFIQTGGSDVISRIVAGDGRSTIAVFTVPEGSMAFLKRADFTAGKGMDATVKAFRRLEDGPFVLGAEIDIYQNMFSRDFEIPLPLPEKSDLRVDAVSSNENTKVNVNAILVLYQGSEITGGVLSL